MPHYFLLSKLRQLDRDPCLAGNIPKVMPVIRTFIAPFLRHRNHPPIQQFNFFLPGQRVAKAKKSKGVHACSDDQDCNEQTQCSLSCISCRLPPGKIFPPCVCHAHRLPNPKKHCKRCKEIPCYCQTVSATTGQARLLDLFCDTPQHRTTSLFFFLCNCGLLPLPQIR